LAIGQGLAEVLKQYRPQAMALEKTFFAKNADSATKLGQARGVCLYEAARAGVPVLNTRLQRLNQTSPAMVERAKIKSSSSCKRCWVAAHGQIRHE